MTGNLNEKNILKGIFKDNSQKDYKMEKNLKKTLGSKNYEVIEHISSICEENLRNYLRGLYYYLLKPLA